MTNQALEVEGSIVQIQGAVVDVEFPVGTNLPDIYDAIRVPRGTEEPDLVLEVQNHLGHSRVRTVAMDATDGFSRGMSAFGTGGPITVPVGQAPLGGIFNVLGGPRDNQGRDVAQDNYPFHPADPP